MKTKPACSLSSVDEIVDFLNDILPHAEFASEYGEPGYQSIFSPPALIVLSTYWCRCSNYEDEQFPDAPLHEIFVHYPDELEALKDFGVEFEWDDEWVVVDDKAYRTKPDSYTWKPSAVFCDACCEYHTPDTSDEGWIECFKNDPYRCIPEGVLETPMSLRDGWERWPDDDTEFEHGWHPGQNASPDVIDLEIREAHGRDVDVVFVLDRVGQFDVAFSAYFRKSVVAERSVGLIARDS